MAIGCVLFAVTTAVFADSWLLGGVGASGAVAWASLMTWFDHRSELPVNPVARQYLILGFFYLMVCLVLIASWAFGLPAA